MATEGVGGTVRGKKGMKGTGMHKFIGESVLWIQINKLRKAQFKAAMMKGLAMKTLLNDRGLKRFIMKDLVMLRRTT